MEEADATSVSGHRSVASWDLCKMVHLTTKQHKEKPALPPPYQLFLLFCLWLAVIVDGQFGFLLSFPETHPRSTTASGPDKREPAAFPEFHSRAFTTFPRSSQTEL